MRKVVVAAVVGIAGVEAGSIEVVVVAAADADAVGSLLLLGSASSRISVKTA